MKAEILTLPEIRDLYRSRMVHDFPENEIKPLGSIESAMNRGVYQCLGWRDGNEILAYAFFAFSGRQYLLDYYAVREDLRGTGVGSRFLRELCGHHLEGAECALLETDDPEYADTAEETAVRKRRLQFYPKNGLTDTGVRATVFGAEFIILRMPVAGAAYPDPAQAYARIYREILPERLCSRMVRVYERRTD